MTSALQRRLAGVRSDSVSLVGGKRYRIPKRNPTAAVRVGDAHSAVHRNTQGEKRTTWCRTKAKKVAKGQKPGMLHHCKQGGRYGK